MIIEKYKNAFKDIAIKVEIIHEKDNGELHSR